MITPGESLARGSKQMATNVNLDALIPREDFEVATTTDDAPNPQTITIRDLESAAFFYLALRKPDFQRESSEWDAKRVSGLIKTFIQGDLIPSVILWKHQEHLFVIDGSHRLSALIAWVQDDYGDGDRSQRVFGTGIPSDQLRHADNTRQLVAKEIGSYADHFRAASDPQNYGPDIVASSRALGSRTLSLQWVRGDSAKAENSFIRINQQAATITPQELSLIRGRKRPDVIAARAIVKRGVGYIQGGRFDEATLNEIKSQAEKINNLLFAPELSYPIKSLDLPVGGAVYSGPALKMVHDLVELSVGKIREEDDVEGKRTLEFLRSTKNTLELICSNQPKSIGLHPGIYFYSWTGKHQPILLLTVSEIIVELRNAKKLDSFIQRRSRLESFLINHRTLLNQIVRKFGTKDSGRQHLKHFYQVILDALGDGKAEEEIVTLLTNHKEFTYLQPSESPYSGVSPTRYSAQIKSGLIISELVPKAPRCAICQGLVPHQAISIDHKVRRTDGGKSNLENLQLAHGYCNSGIKEKALAKTTSK